VTIRQLPRDVIDRIAAGEVVERPAAVLKELLENALDARARHVDVSIEGGGLRLVRVADDGVGIPADELPAAFASHATSKLVDVDDLMHIVSFGFRGEALCSIGAVSRSSITSATGDDGRGHRLACIAGELGSVEPVAAARGTVVEVRELFFNTPARRQFLGSERTEAARCRETLMAMALVHPDAHLRLSIDGVLRFSSPATEQLAERVVAVHGREFFDGLTALHGRGDACRLEGFLSLPAAARPRARAQQLFVNGRLVKDRQIASAVRLACRDFIPPNLQPSWIVYLTIDPAAVDVNVHPTKSEVRFRSPDDVFRLVHHATRQALLGADLAPRVRAEHLGPSRARGPAPAGGVSGGLDPGHGRAAVPPARRAAAASGPPSTEAWSGGATSAGAAAGPVAGESGPAAATQAPGADRVHERLPHTALRPAARYLQVLDTYLVHDAPEGLVLIDQHALHERVLYARWQRQLAEGRLPCQRLLVPETLALDPALHAAALERRDELLRCGLEIEDFGPDTLVVRSVPAVLRGESLHDLVVALIAPPEAHGGIPSGLDRRLFTLACHAAVKAGDSLAEAEIAELLQQAAELEHDTSCPHGRPTRLVIGRIELERLFKRSGF